MDSTSLCIKLAELFRTFIKNTIIGHESGLYKIFGNNPIVPTMIHNITINYFNRAYDGLATKSDHYIIEKIKNMQDCLNHSPVCLINLLAIQCLKIHTSFDRSQLDANTYDKYMASVRKEFEAKAPPTEEMATLFKHNCTGNKEAQILPEGQELLKLSIHEIS